MYHSEPKRLNPVRLESSFDVHSIGMNARDAAGDRDMRGYFLAMSDSESSHVWRAPALDFGPGWLSHCFGAVDGL